MLDPHVDTLFDVPVMNSFVDDDSNGGFGDVVYNPCLAMIDLVRHSVQESEPRVDVGPEIDKFESFDSPLLHSAVGLDVDNVAYSVRVSATTSQIPGKLDVASKTALTCIASDRWTA